MDVAAAALRNLSQVHDDSLPRLPSAPARAIQRTYPGAPHTDSSSIDIELERLPTAASTPGKSVVAVSVRRGAPESPGLSRSASSADLESSRPVSPVLAETEVRQSWHDPYKNRFRVAACSMINFLAGMNDGASGAVIPYMEKYYNAGYGTVSLIFVGNAVGFIISAFLLDTIRHHLGRDKTLLLSQSMTLLGFIPMALGAPFPLIVISFFLFGAGSAIFLAIANIFCGSLQNATSILGMMHGCYGIGATIAPLVATSIVTGAHQPWHRYYFLTLGLTLFTIVFAPWSFWNYNGPEDTPAATAAADIQQPNKLLAMFRALRSRIVLLGAIFIFSYQGSEVSISGWVISFLISARNGDPASVGYVTAGFWGGITLGRFLLSAPAHKIGEKLFVYGAVAGAIVFEGLVWGVPDIVGDAVAVSIVGLLLGPVYPCAMAVFLNSMTRKEKLSGVGVITAFGSSGGAVAPFVTGILAQAISTWVLHPVVIFFFSVMLAAWWGIPGIRKRKD
ncbi:hypothetical protein TD95_005065 [Thielaviopsis punctulata]|uniref:Major facilitator superfamily (MFS) profile domain-containing protein n=1 Tax=Thielaviopsis punctulata TaxID=72032 RepID=A0A0F4ZIP6_9PEZI|nr:hypothetical protein TD95_005065 [Thielaviopsis punctulata]